MPVKYIPTLSLSPLITSSCWKLPVPMASGTGHASCVRGNLSFPLPIMVAPIRFTPRSLLLSFQLFFQFGTKLPVRYFHFTVLLSLQESPNLCSLFTQHPLPIHMFVADTIFLQGNYCQRYLCPPPFCSHLISSQGLFIFF